MTFTKKNVLWVKSIAIIMILCVCILQTRSYLNGACDIYPYTSSFCAFTNRSLKIMLFSIIIPAFNAENIYVILWNLFVRRPLQIMKL